MVNTKNLQKKKKNSIKNRELAMYKSSKRLVLILFSLVYSIVVLSNLFLDHNIDDNILLSLEIMIGTCIGGITATHIFNKK